MSVRMEVGGSETEQEKCEEMDERGCGCSHHCGTKTQENLPEALKVKKIVFPDRTSECGCLRLIKSVTATVNNHDVSCCNINLGNH